MRDLFREELEILAPHIEDSIRNGDFEMSKQYGVYGLNEQEIDITDEDVAQVWGELQAVPSYVEREAIAAKQQALALDAISAIQKEERDVSHSLYAALCGLWLAECGDRDMAEARVVVQARLADMRAFVDSIEVELGL